MTDPARTTKEEREAYRDHALTLPLSERKDWRNRICDDADAADALRAQVAALQAENEKLQKTASYQLAIANRAVAEKLYAELAQCKAELAAAQAKLAVPVPEDVRDTISYLRGNPDCPGSSDERDIADMLTALARDNAALRTKAEALELERSERALDKMAENAKELGLDYDAMKPDGPLTKAGMRRAARLLLDIVEPVDNVRGIVEAHLVVTGKQIDDMLRLARQLYAKAREPKP